MQRSRRDVLRSGAAMGAVVWTAPAVTGVHRAQAAASPPQPEHAISFVGIVYQTLSADGTSPPTLHLIKAEFGPGATTNPDEGEYAIVDGRWLVETQNPELPSCDTAGGEYLPGDVTVIDPAGPLAGAQPPAGFADELDEDGEPRRVILGVAEGHELVSVHVKCATDCVSVGAAELDQTFDGKYVVENCAYYLERTATT